MNIVFCSPECLSRSSVTAAGQVPERERGEFMGRGISNASRSFISHHGSETFFSSGHLQGLGDFWLPAKEAKFSLPPNLK